MMASAIEPSELTIPADCPLRFGRAEAFARVRQFLQDAGYNDVSLCPLLGISDMSHVGDVAWDKLPLDTYSPALRLCLTLFLRVGRAAASEVSSVCGPETFDALQALGLLRPSKQQADGVVPTVWLYPADGFVLASDLAIDPDGAPFTTFEDIVFPASYRGTLEFLRYLPNARGGDALDLCGGSGIGALHIARTAATAVSADIAMRSAVFAAFNDRLNDGRTVSLCGDLYEPVEGRQFDVISAHPPYVPHVGRQMIYRDGGVTGEEVTQRIVEGLPRHLRSGGTCVIFCLGRDTHEHTFEQRARQWLGDAAQDFDVVLGTDRFMSPDETVNELRRRMRENVNEQLQELAARLLETGTKQFVHGALCLRRYAEPVTLPPLRVRLSPEASAADFERVLAWRQRRRQPGFEDWLSAARPRYAPHAELNTRYVVEDGALAMADLVFQTEHGFEAALRLDPWMLPLLARLNGQHSTAEAFRAAHAEGELPEAFPFKALAELVAIMVEKGFLQLDRVD